MTPRTKTEAIQMLGGSVKAASETMGCKASTVEGWPEELTAWHRREVKRVMTAPPNTLTPCAPRETQKTCGDCARRTAATSESRPRLIVIDATVLKWPHNLCPMKVTT